MPSRRLFALLMVYASIVVTATKSAALQEAQLDITPAADVDERLEIGRASCRERV